MAVSLKVLTLNCWGISLPWPVGSPDRRIRISAIADMINSGEWDVVSLQEIWSDDDFNFIRSRVSLTMPGAFYFHSGYLGSGVCVFTKGIIVDTLMHRFSLNGYAHHIHRGDWFGGKIVGLARVRLNNLDVNVYATHFHAEYDRDNDLYLPHRVLQAFELSQFVKATSTAFGDVSLAVGDFNLEPVDLGYLLVLSNGDLHDSYVEQRADDAIYQKDSGCTCGVPTNSYASPVELIASPNGKRIDYIMYRSNDAKQTTITVQKCNVLHQHVPDKPQISLSDHEAVSAEFQVARTGTVAVVEKPAQLTRSRSDLLKSAIDVMNEGIAKATYDRRFYGGVLIFLIVLLMITVDIEVECNSTAITLLALSTRFSFTLMIGFCLWYGCIVLTMERKALKAAVAGMRILLQDGKNIDDGGGEK